MAVDVSVRQHNPPKRLDRAPPRSRDTPTAAIHHLGPEAHVYQQGAGQRWLFSSFPLPAGSACAAGSRREKDAHGVREPGEGWGGPAGAVEAAGGALSALGRSLSSRRPVAFPSRCRTCCRTYTTAGRWTRPSCRKRTAWWSSASGTTGTPRA